MGDGDTRDRTSAREAISDALTVVRDIAAKQSPINQDRGALVLGAEVLSSVLRRLEKAIFRNSHR